MLQGVTKVVQAVVNPSECDYTDLINVWSRPTASAFFKTIFSMHTKLDKKPLTT